MDFSPFSRALILNERERSAGSQANSCIIQRMWRANLLLAEELIPSVSAFIPRTHIQMPDFHKFSQLLPAMLLVQNPRPDHDTPFFEGCCSMAEGLLEME